MQTTTITRPLPEIDEEIATRTGDEILLEAAKGEKVKKVSSTGRSTFQSHTVRAWTRSGNVD